MSEAKRGQGPGSELPHKEPELVLASRTGFTPAETWTELRVALVAIVIAHLADLGSTYLRTPDLSREASPLYLALAQAGWGGWGSLVAIKLLGMALSVALFAFYLRRRRTLLPSQPGLSFHDFLHAVHSKDALRRADGRWLAPSPMLLGVWLAFSLSIGSAAYSYFLAVHNLIGTPFMYWLDAMVAPVAIFVVTAMIFWRQLYRQYQHVVVES